MQGDGILSSGKEQTGEREKERKKRAIDLWDHSSAEPVRGMRCELASCKLQGGVGSFARASKQPELRA